jgi:hypothetical protein
MQTDDRTLLKGFATDRDEAAFRELSRRYLGLIFHAALRRTGSRRPVLMIALSIFNFSARSAVPRERQTPYHC